MELGRGTDYLVELEMSGETASTTGWSSLLVSGVAATAVQARVGNYAAWIYAGMCM